MFYGLVQHLIQSFQPILPACLQGRITWTGWFHFSWRSNEYSLYAYTEKSGLDWQRLESKLDARKCLQCGSACWKARWVRCERQSDMFNPELAMLISATRPWVMRQVKSTSCPMARIQPRRLLVPHLIVPLLKSTHLLQFSHFTGRLGWLGTLPFFLLKQYLLITAALISNH